MYFLNFLHPTAYSSRIGKLINLATVNSDRKNGVLSLSIYKKKLSLARSQLSLFILNVLSSTLCLLVPTSEVTVLKILSLARFAG
jgi:hypothetical protein